MLKTILIAVGVVAGALWLNNSSMLSTPSPQANTRVLAHRGVFQSYPPDDVGRDTCTATRIRPPSHDLIENTLASMRAAFDAGAAVVELDIHLTPDGKFAVFHDWTLECRTDAKGVTEETPYSVLKTLDVGYGYTADGGKTFPLRGKGKGLMPELTEVFEAFPSGQFLVNYKSRRVEEGTALAALIRARPAFKDRIFGVYGGAEPTRTAMAAIPGLRGFDPQSVKACLLRYAALGWSGYVPNECRNTIVAVPANAAPWLWGWPHTFMARMQAVGTEVILLGPWSGGATAGIDAPSEINLVPEKFGGLVWTNRTETMARPILDR
jgi:glycerophosphoryl diester phosphodiesterase